MPTATTYFDGPPPAADRAVPRGCDHPGCDADGQFRAPRARDALNSYYWFCLEHVRAYNRAWNWCSGMSTDDVESQVRRDSVWQRPTWRFGTGPAAARAAADNVADPYGLFRRGRARPEPKPDARAHEWSPLSPAGKALKILEMDQPVTLAEVKLRYKELAKKHHPDANGGCRAAEERLKSINVAYQTLRTALTA